MTITDLTDLNILHTITLSKATGNMFRKDMNLPFRVHKGATVKKKKDATIKILGFLILENHGEK